MHSHDLSRWSHNHHYAYGHERESERRTTLVVALTGIMMIVEIICGWLFNSMALLADGWHMATHTVALGVGVYAYRYARLNADNPSYSFGTGKVHALGGFTSALFLGAVAVIVFSDSLWTMINPEPIQYNQALLVAVLGLVVNVASIKLLHRGGHHHHDHDGHEHEYHHSHGHEHDHNLKAAYAHVLVDAMTSVFAIVALLVGKYLDWNIVDPIVGIVGAVVIALWAYKLIKSTTDTLLDREPSTETVQHIKEKIQEDGDSEIADLHVWYIAPGRLAAIISVVSHESRTAEEYKKRLHDLDIAHLTIELNHCASKAE